MNENGIELQAMGLAPGNSMRDICPRCGGGGSKEKSLSLTVTEDGWLLWNCYRASCGYAGRKILWGVVREDRVPTPKPPQTFDGALMKNPGKVQVWLYKNFGLNAAVVEDLGWRYAPESDRIYIPYFGPMGQFRGSLLREWETSYGKKSIVYKQLRDEPFMGWQPDTGSGPPVLVEDAFSAAKVYQAGITAISLCGTNLSSHMVREILTKYPAAHLALDKDAYAKAVEYVGTYRELIGLTVWHLEQDLKYEKEERVREAYYGKAVDFRRTKIPKGI